MCTAAGSPVRGRGWSAGRRGQTRVAGRTDGALADHRGAPATAATMSLIRGGLIHTQRPKGIDLSVPAAAGLKSIADEINNRPRHVLGRRLQPRS